MKYEAECPVYRCISTYEIRHSRDTKTRCPKCGFSEDDVEKYGTNDPVLLLQLIAEDLTKKKVK